jgi:hypothetical protein
MTITIPWVYINIFVCSWCLGAAVAVMLRYICREMINYFRLKGRAKDTVTNILLMNVILILTWPVTIFLLFREGYPEIKYIFERKLFGPKG